MHRKEGSNHVQDHGDGTGCDRYDGTGQILHVLCVVGKGHDGGNAVDACLNEVGKRDGDGHAGNDRHHICHRGILLPHDQVEYLCRNGHKDAGGNDGVRALTLEVVSAAVDHVKCQNHVRGKASSHYYRYTFDIDNSIQLLGPPSQ